MPVKSLIWTANANNRMKYFVDMDLPSYKDRKWYKVKFIVWITYIDEGLAHFFGVCVWEGLLWVLKIDPDINLALRRCNLRGQSTETQGGKVNNLKLSDVFIMSSLPWITRYCDKMSV